AVHDIDPDKLAEFRKQNVGIIYQQANWIKSLSVIENVAFPLELLGVDQSKAHKEAMEKLELVGMQEWQNYNPADLSAGQQQKVALARALVTDPKVIFADEPTGNLDSKSGSELLQIFRELVDKGKSLIM